MGFLANWRRPFDSLVELAQGDRRERCRMAGLAWGATIAIAIAIAIAITGRPPVVISCFFGPKSPGLLRMTSDKSHRQEYTPTAKEES
jgi:hypothetical protein